MVYKKILWEKFSQRIFLSVNGGMTVNEKFLLTFAVSLKCFVKLVCCIFVICSFTAE